MTRRLVLLCSIVLLVAQLAAWGEDFLIGLWVEFGPDWCQLPPGRAPDAGSSLVCQQVFRRPSLVTYSARLTVLAAMLAACYPLIRWCLRPVRDLAPVIANVGPQNLGHRLRPGTGRDELAVLGRAIDEMMDRISIGYEAQRRFAADASHELRTPLAVQRTLIEVSMASPLTGEQAELLTAQLLATNERNEQLIEGLLVLSESDRGLVARAPLRLDEIVAGVLAAHQDQATEAGVTLVGELAPRVVAGEQVLLERLVTNLVQNALKYNRADGTVEVTVGEDPALVVSNTGDDIPAAEVPALFEPFRRRSGTRIDHSGGAGLGLAIARSITRAHDGIIAASSTGHDGLTVRVSLPAYGAGSVTSAN